MAESETIRIAEAARIIGCGRASAYAAAKNGQIPTISVGKLILVPRKALYRLLECEQNDRRED